jgi:hypothetical protein
MQNTVMAKNIIIHKIRTTTPTNPNNDRNRDGNLNTGLEKWYTYVIIVFMHCALNIQVQENQTNLDYLCHFDNRCGLTSNLTNRTGGVRVIVIAQRAVDRWFDHGWVKRKTMKLVFRISSVSTQQSGVRTKTGWLVIEIMCSSGTTCLL